MSEEPEERILTRECEAIQIPSGEFLTLPAMSKVHITQRLGGSFTVMTDYGLARINPENVDAIGESTEAEETQAKAESTGEKPDEDAIWSQLKNVYDPEIPVNIVDLGLVYSLRLDELESGGYKTFVEMTLTAPGCGMGPAIAEDARGKVMLVPNVEEAEVDITWEPAWNQNMISEEGKMILGLV